MAQDPIFTLYHLGKSYRDRAVLREITLSFLPGAKIGVIGHNGAGKSTLLRILAGEEQEFEGVARPAEGLRRAYVPQEPKLDGKLDVAGNLEPALAPARALMRQFEELNESLASDPKGAQLERTLRQLAEVQDRIDARGAWDLDRQLDQAVHALGLPPKDALVETLSGGEKRRVALCRALMQQPDLLLLDEPTNHLDADAVQWLEKHLQEYPGTVIVITHDRSFLDRVAGWMLELDHGRATPFEGNYSSYLEQKQERLRLDARQETSRRKLLSRELEWIRMSPRARVAKNKARIRNYEALAAKQREVREGNVRLHIPSGPRLGARVIRFKKVSKSFGPRPLIKDLSFDLPPGGIIGVIGPNGAGKTTLLKLITGELEPDTGLVTLGETVQLCYVDQAREDLDPQKTVYEEITDGRDFIKLGPLEVASRAYVARFNFRGTDQQKKVGACSGGMRNRIQLAKMLRRGGNVILLDEPTNDLDLQTLQVLEDALLGFPGCVVAVSHDRYFLNRLATHLLVFERAGKVHVFEGTYEALLKQRQQDRESRGLAPNASRAKHRRLR